MQATAQASLGTPARALSQVRGGGGGGGKHRRTFEFRTGTPSEQYDVGVPTHGQFNASGGQYNASVSECGQWDAGVSECEQCNASGGQYNAIVCECGQYSAGVSEREQCSVNSGQCKASVSAQLTSVNVHV